MKADAMKNPKNSAPLATVGHALPHESAPLHVTGRAAYADDIPEPIGTLHAALGLSPVAHGRLLGVDVAALRALPGVVAVYTAADIPGENNCGPIVQSPHRPFQIPAVLGSPLPTLARELHGH